VINLSHAFDGKDLFKGIGFQIEPGDRIGLVGPNGSGKTTLLRLLNGLVEAISGEIRITRGTRIGYLPQDLQEKPTGLLLDSTLNSIPERAQLNRKIQEINQSLNAGTDEHERSILNTRLAEVQQAMLDLETLYPAHQAQKILAGLGFKPEDFQRELKTFSGGWQMRAALGSLLYQNPDLFLLDEPTNHLDLPSVRWLEEFLQGYKGAIVLICHDRDFLNRQVRRILSFEPEGIRAYTGNYAFYLKAREEERRTLDNKARNQEQKIKEAKRFIERFQAKASKARQAQSKIKLMKNIKMVQTHKRRKSIRFSFPTVEQSGRNVVTIQGLTKGFGARPLYQNLNLHVLRGERVAIIGPNGAGKTTLLRMLAQEMQPDQGQITLGHGVNLSYYAQHHSEMLDGNKTILEEVYEIVPHEAVSFVRGICGAFLFSGEDVDKSISVLSGGERARVALAKILVKPGNLLIMDEPTNHLDIISSEILTDALTEFGGTILFVSHNQYLVNRLATRIWDIKPGEVVEYPGKLYEYLEHLSAIAGKSDQYVHEGSDQAEEQAQESPKSKITTRKQLRRERAEQRQRIRVAIKPVQDQLHDLEKRIAVLEKKEQELGQLLADPHVYKDNEKYPSLLREYKAGKSELEELLEKWEKTQQELEE
jgi:ATP-binding cassette subfamily F protein 3